MDVELRHLRHFVAVAEELNFSRAAERLRMSQPPLSSSIRRLERMLGVQLLERTTRSVGLTPAGVVLLAHARQVLQSVDTAVRSTRRRAAGAESLVIGMQSGGVPLLRRLLDALPGRFSQLEVSVVRTTWAEDSLPLQTGRVDVAFLYLPFDTAGLCHEVLVTEPRLAGLPADHPLAGESSLALSQLSDVPVVTSPGVPRAMADFWMVNPRPDGSAPLPGPPVHGLEDKLDAVALGAGMFFAPASIGRYRNSAVAFVPVIDIPPAQFALAWPERTTHPAACELIGLARGRDPLLGAGTPAPAGLTPRRGGGRA